MTQFSRANPSPRYRELLNLYRTMHQEGESFMNLPAEKTFPGYNILREAPKIKRLIQETGSENILDYGSGKGKQYHASPFELNTTEQWPNVIEYWNISEVRCYDPAYTPFNQLPDEIFDGVVSTDVLEHCPEEDIPWILAEIFSRARKFIFANIACYAASKHLPNGENAHCTIQTQAWWEARIHDAAQAHPTVRWEVWLQWFDPQKPGQLREVLLSSQTMR